MLKIVLLSPVLLLSVAIVLVRFTDLSIRAERGFTLLNYRETEHAWTVYNWEPYSLETEDGPYIYQRGDSLEVIYVLPDSAGWKVNRHIQAPDSLQSFICKSINADRDSFRFTIKNEYPIPADTFAMPDKLLALSDIEGNFNSFFGLLRSNGVMNAQAEWTFGAGHLVLLGDFVDRGDEVTQVLWLIYHLENQAQAQGGMVHYILGNHEVMNLRGDHRYVQHKYLALGMQLGNLSDHSAALKQIYADDAVLTRWMLSKNCIERIGNLLFVHGGISPELCRKQLQLNEINRIHRETARVHPSKQANPDSTALLVGGRLGPLWYRGLVEGLADNYPKSTMEEVDQALMAFGAERIIIGHTIVSEVSGDFEGKVIRLDIKQSRNKFSGQNQGLLIENGQLFRVNDRGDRSSL